MRNGSKPNKLYLQLKKSFQLIAECHLWNQVTSKWQFHFYFLLSVISHLNGKKAALMWVKSSGTHKQPLTHCSCWGLHCKYTHTKAVGGWQDWVKRVFYLSVRGTVQINAVERPQIRPQWGAEAGDLRDICILWLDCSSAKWEPERLWSKVIIYILARLAEKQKMAFHFLHTLLPALVPPLCGPCLGVGSYPTEAPPQQLTAGDGMPGWARAGKEVSAKDPSWQRQKFCWWVWACLCAEVGQDPLLTITGADVNLQAATAAVAIKSSEDRFILCTKDISACSSSTGIHLICLRESSPPCHFPGMRWMQGHSF